MWAGLPWACGRAVRGSEPPPPAMSPSLPPHACVGRADLWATSFASPPHPRHHFVIRVGAKCARAPPVWTRGHARSVYFGPDQAARKHQPPLVLRLVVVPTRQAAGIGDLYPPRLSGRQVADDLPSPGGVEFLFRTLSKLRCRSAQPLGAERAVGGLVPPRYGRLSARVRELRAAGTLPARLTRAALQAFQHTLREYRVRPETPTETLWAQLGRARLDDYQRRSSKTSRAYPRKKQRPLIGIPRITRATPHQIAQAQALQHQEEFEEFRLSA